MKETIPKDESLNPSVCSFPSSFVWGASTSSYQIEGGASEDGRGPSIWDAWSHIPGKIKGNDNGDVACDHYHLWPEDIKIVKELGVKAYRLSISWSRIFPDGRNLNQKGLDFYDKLIDAIHNEGIDLWVTLYHWDMPLALQLEIEGFTNRQIIELFVLYAETCFQHFGDRVKQWITFNEPYCIAYLGYGKGEFPPGKISDIHPLTSGHNLLLAHGSTVQLYREKYQSQQKGQIGIVVSSGWKEPKSKSKEDEKAAIRALEFDLAWFADPIIFGDYPSCMKERISCMPVFTEEEKKLVKGSVDFFGVNHYTTSYCSETNQVDGLDLFSAARRVQEDIDPKWPKNFLDWPIVPQGINKLIKFIHERYPQIPLYITENGCVCKEETEEDSLKDEMRQNYLRDYLAEIAKSIQDGADVRGYFVWSLLDNFEWNMGYEARFGIVRVDFETQKRTWKGSAHLYKKIVKSNCVYLESQS